ncbi:protein kinase [Aquihabitans daechungensis]|uniref:serine/threonine-protein kinase n=1 Tax=Aquihabitans daechungensis TaxID=1052257 RepID=UPI003BA279E5
MPCGGRSGAGDLAVIAADARIAGRYRLRSQIGGGGMGAVWLAVDERLGREVAIKHVLAATDVDPETATAQRQRAMREGRIAARLSHPHAIAIYDVAEEDGEPWLVMEYLPSRSLAAVLADAGVLRVDQVAQIGAQLADALGAVHSAGIVHRDVKPANVLIGQGETIEGLVKITDFGISHASGDVTLTQTGMITGTPAYLAPEVARGIEPGPAADVFALGATLYTCLEGQPPFGTGDNALQQLHLAAAGTIEPPQRAGALTQPLLRMLAADPGDRPSMQQVRNELVSLAAGRDGDTTAVLAVPTDITPAGRTPHPTPPAPFPGAAAPGGMGRSDAPTVSASRVPDAPGASVPPEPLRVAASPEPGSSRPSRRRPLVVWAAAAVAVVVFGLAAAWALSRGDDPEGEAATRADATETEPTASDNGAPATSTAPPPVDDAPTATTVPDDAPVATTGPDTGDEEGAAGGQGEKEGKGKEEEGGGQATSGRSVERFLSDYHGLVTTDPAAAYDLAGPTLRDAISREDFEAFWSAFDRVRISNVRSADDGSATADVQLLYDDGTVQVERHRYEFVDEDGERLLDRDEFIEVISSRG